MRLLPGSCGDLVLPEECLDGAFEVADCLVDIGIEALVPFAPQITGDCPGFRGFVTFGEQHPDDLCDQLTVSLTSLTPRVLGKRPGVCVSYWEATFAIEAVFDGWPAIEQIGDGLYLPGFEEQEKAARWLMAVGVALADAYGSALNTPTCPAIVNLTSRRAIAPFKPTGPQGACAGWKTMVTLVLGPEPAP